MGAILGLLANAGVNLVEKFVGAGKDKAIEVIKEKTGIDLSKKQNLSQEDILKLKEFENKNKEFLLRETEAFLKDKQNARNMAIEISKNGKDWLVRNTGSLIALFVVTAVFILFGLLLNGNLSIENSNVAMIVGFTGGYVTQILSFYFGSSKTEADKVREK